MKADIQIEHISKSYKNGVEALKDIHFDVKKGELFGLIGPDGAGKTTLFRILTTLLLPDSGQAAVHGWDVVKDYKLIRQHVGYMPGRFSLYPDLSVEENLRFFARIFGTTIEAGYDNIKDIYGQLEPFKKRRAKDLSGGMKQKLALSCAIIHNPSVLFLDEPGTGIDPVSRRDLWKVLKRLTSEGITTLVSTPYMDEAEMCDRVALIFNGEILRLDAPGKIAESFPGQLMAIETSEKYWAIEALKHYAFARSAFLFGDSIHYSDQRENVPIGEIKEYLMENGIQDVQIKFIQPRIEDAFMALAQKS